MSNTSLFDQFISVSAKQWKQQIQVDLKGADYNDTLIWQSPEGIDVKPFYHKDEFDKEFAPIPGQPEDWTVIQQVFVHDVKIGNRLMAEALERGAEGIYLSATSSFDIKSLFDGIDLQDKSIYLNLKFLNSDFLNELIEFLSESTSAVFYNTDIIGNLVRSGNWFNNLSEDHKILESLIQAHPSENMLGVDVSLYQNAGANMVQQLAYGLAQANEYLNHFSKQQDLRLTFSMSLGSNYFFEIAKLRAMRILYAGLAHEYGFREECHIMALPGKRNKTLYDYNVNLLRTTTECMSAVLGGANGVCNLAYDSIYHKSNEFGERISRNQLLILKHESFFDLVENPSDGSYYIEALTDQLAAAALKLFTEIEQGGGFLKALKEGSIQKKIKESAEKEQELFNSGELVLLGTNKHPNGNDRMKGELELYPFVKTKPRKTLLEPVIERRLAEKIEKERIENED